MFQVSVEETFSAGHALRGYRGKCENVHGHNYRVRVTVQGPQLDSIGLLCDFTELKRVIREIIGGLDHQFINDLEPFRNVNPSAENLAKYFYDEVTGHVKELPAGARVTDIVVWETDTASAQYRPGNSRATQQNGAVIQPTAGSRPANFMFITEIFKSIQGEGTRAGLPCIFVRLTGCNLRCTWCDTAYAFHGGKKMSVDAVLARVDELAGRRDGANASRATVPLVELTGGEPLLQEEIYPLAEKLLAAGYTVLIETSGERFVGRLPQEVIKIVDVKCPDSGEADTFEMKNLDAMSTNDEVKFVLSTRRDYEFARDFTLQHQLTQRVRSVLFSPVFDDPEGKWQGLQPRALVEWILADGLPVRLGLQLHKFVWDPATKGV